MLNIFVGGSTPPISYISNKRKTFPTGCSFPSPSRTLSVCVACRLTHVCTPFACQLSMEVRFSFTPFSDLFERPAYSRERLRKIPPSDATVSVHRIDSSKVSLVKINFPRCQVGIDIWQNRNVEKQSSLRKRPLNSSHNNGSTKPIGAAPAGEKQKVIEVIDKKN